ncbi:Endoribonuclease L-PSP-domain-containing protein [Neurospora tetraspora]|uniref:Endoribonuclease L-PSP-domain-containing protein n=1 Tax=Neurospora tetraspora TaxID=94610 RepID=A0AAE0J1G9_9PEZI|nr:Endoribonuclease L-PSP-domain-containing protein [Neurospora tetraspora]
MFAIAARRASRVIFSPSTFSSAAIFRTTSSVQPLYRTVTMSATPVFSKDAAPPAGPYSHAIKTPTAIYCSGQIPCDSEGNLVEGTIQEKTAACIKNLKAVLEAAGSSIEKVVKVNAFLTDMSNFAAMNEEYSKWFTHKPARSCVAVYQLPKGVDVEIECIAIP